MKCKIRQGGTNKKGRPVWAALRVGALSDLGLLHRILYKFH